MGPPTETADELEAGRQPETRSARLRRRLRELDLTQLGLVGFLAVPGYLVDSLAFMQVFGLFFLFFLWGFLEPLLDLALKRNADTETEPTDWIHMGDRREWITAYLMIVPTFLNPLVLLQDFLQLLGTAVAYLRHRGSVPDAEYDLETSYRLPVEGTWTVVNGSLREEYSHSWIPVNQRYAYDFVITDEDGRSRPEGTTPAVEEYYCYDEPVLAPADGVVVDVFDTDLEPARGGGFSHPLKRTIPGNYVTIQHAPDEYSCLAHLVPDSLEVEPGEGVSRGQQVGRCGHTGNSSEPHLHFQVQDHPTFELSAGLPVRFEGVAVDEPWEGDGDESATAADALEGAQSADDLADEPTAITAGQRVTSVDASADVTRDAGRSGQSPSPSTADRNGVAVLERLAFGFAVGGVVALVFGLVVSPSVVALALLGAAIVGVVVPRVVTATESVSRPGAVGVPLALALLGSLWWVDPQAVGSSATVALVGILGYVLVATYDGARLRRAFETGGRSQTASHGEADT